MAYSPDGQRLASGDGCPPWEHVDHLRTPGIVRVWEEATGHECLVLRGHTQNVMGVTFSPDGHRLATVSGGVLAVPLVAAKPGELMIWNAKDGALIQTVRGHDGPLTAVAYSPDGQTLATSSWDRTVMLWDAQDRYPAIHAGGPSGLGLSRHVRRLRATAGDGRRRWGRPALGRRLGSVTRNVSRS